MSRLRFVLVIGGAVATAVFCRLLLSKRNPGLRPEPAVVADAKALPASRPMRVTERKANLMGRIPILMYHKFQEKETRFSRSFEHFRGDLERLYDLGFRPVTMSEYLEEKIDIPPGSSPVVITMDDSATSQFQLLPDGSIDPNTAVGIWSDFAKTHPDFPVKGTWYVLPGVMWGQRPLRDKKVEMLKSWGSELASHTWEHPMLNHLSDEQVKMQIAKSIDFLKKYGYEHVSFAYPYGLKPKNMTIMEGFDYKGKHYSVTGAVLTDTNLARSTSSEKWHKYRLPRIEATELEDGIKYWLDLIESEKFKVYVAP